jgi:3-deoxy-7-phosphoheptulonate synthase
LFDPKGVTIIAGPCAIESRDQLFKTAQAVKEAGIKLLRGGAYKPRTSPYTFQGLEEEGLKLLAEAGQKFGLFTVTELTDTEFLQLVLSHVEVVQVGARNMDNYALLKRLGAATAENKKWVLLKRGFAATIKEWLLAAEYITSAGNPNVVLCERGIRTFETATRFTLDLNAVPMVKRLSSLPIIVDTSHGTGHADLVIPMSRAAVASGADGVMVEVHPDPKKALCDGAQSLDFNGLKELVKSLRPVANALGKKLFSST